MKIPEFREEVAAGLDSMTDKRPVGRPSSAQSENRSMSPQPGSSGIGKQATHPVADVRFDGVDHYPNLGDNKLSFSSFSQNMYATCVVSCLLQPVLDGEINK